MILKKVVMVLYKKQSQHLRRGAKENQDALQLGRLVSGPKFQSGYLKQEGRLLTTWKRRSIIKTCNTHGVVFHVD
jgi:hypothetical protein